MHVIMGLGPWYRIGLSLSNAIILVALIETIVTINAGSHSFAYSIARFNYGFNNAEPFNLAKDIRENPEWALVAVVFILQITADVLLWLAVIIKGNRHFAIIWVFTVIAKTMYSAFIYIREDWDQEYESISAIQKIISFLWGTVLFGFCVLTGIQTHFLLSSEEGKVKLSPVGQGLAALRDYYRETPGQLAIILLLSEIASNIHRSFHYPITAFLSEAEKYLTYTTAPKEIIQLGTQNSIATIAVNAVGLILLACKNSGAKKAWEAVYVIIILVDFIFLVYIVIDWSPVNIHPHMFNGFVGVSLTHLVYKLGILYIYLKSSP